MRNKYLHEEITRLKKQLKNINKGCERLYHESDILTTHLWEGRDKYEKENEILKFKNNKLTHAINTFNWDSKKDSSVLLEAVKETNEELGYESFPPPPCLTCWKQVPDEEDFCQCQSKLYTPLRLLKYMALGSIVGLMIGIVL